MYSEEKEMSEEDKGTEGAGEGKPADESAGGKNDDKDTFESKVQQTVETQLKPIKESLDKAYAARDEALKKVAEFERQQREAEVQRLRDEGKHREAYEKEIAAERAARQALEEQNVRLTRDIEVKSAMQTLPFRSENASEMAFKEISAQLTKNDRGEWVHKSGISIKDFVKAFSEDEDNAFLFKSKASTGTGSTGTSQASESSSESKSLFALPQEEVLRRAAAGQLRRAPT